MKKTMTAATVLLVSILVSGCIIVSSEPRPVVTRQTVVAPPPAPVVVTEEVEYVPPREYVVEAPVYYETAPGIAFYPIFINTPGSCFCVVPMRYYRGAWIGVDNVVIHRGPFPFYHPEPRHIEQWHSRGGVVNGVRPIRGVFENHEGRFRPMPPPGTVHHQVVMQRTAGRENRQQENGRPANTGSSSDNRQSQTGNRQQEHDQRTGGGSSPDNRQPQAGTRQQEHERPANTNSSPDNRQPQAGTRQQEHDPRAGSGSSPDYRQPQARENTRPSNAPENRQVTQQPANAQPRQQIGAPVRPQQQQQQQQQAVQPRPAGNTALGAQNNQAAKAAPSAAKKCYDAEHKEKKC